MNIAPWFLGVIAFSAIITYLIIRRIDLNSKKEKKSGCIAYGYVFLIAFSLSIFVYMLGGMMVENIYNSITAPKYEATIVSYTSYIDNDDDDGPQTMYISTVEFTTKDGEKMTRQTNIHSGGVPKIGKKLTIVYSKSGEVHELTFRSIGLEYVGMGVMLFIMAMALFAGINFALNRSNAWLGKIFMGFLMYFLFPGAMLGFIAAFAWVLWRYFNGLEDDMPIWVVFICSLFLTLLIPSFIGYVKMMFEKDKKKKKRKKRIRPDYD